MPIAPGTVTVPLRSHRNASPFWIIFLLVSGQKDQQMIPPSAIGPGASNLSTGQRCPPIAVYRMKPRYGLNLALRSGILDLARITSHSAGVSKLIKEVFLSRRAWLMESH
jgi:hypothetical protein